MSETTVEARPVGDGTLNPLNYLYKPGLAGGQLAHGGTASAETLELRGSADADTGRITLGSGSDITFNWNTQAGISPIRWGNVIPSSGGIVTAGIDFANTITVDNALFILSALDDHSTLTWTVAPGFAVTTLFFARQAYRSTTAGVAPAQSFIYAAQCVYDIQGAGNVTVGSYRALSFAPILRARNAGDTLTITNVNGVTVGPLWNTNNAAATVDFGTIRGVHMLNPAAVLFGQSLGTERCQNYIGLDVNSITLATVGVRAAVRSALVAATPNFFLLNTGGAVSQFGAGGAHFNDSAPVQFGGTAFNSQDASLFWNPAGSLDFFFAANSDSLQLSNPVNNQLLINGTTNELTMNTTAGFSLGAQTGTNGNQFGNFVFGASTVSIAGEYSQFLLTQAGNLTVNQAGMNIFAWTINAPSITLSGPGSVLTSAVLNVGGNPNQGTVGRFGVRILSNPSGATDNYPLYVVNGTSRINGLIAGDPGTEASGITVGGTLYDSALKVSSLGGGDEAQFIMHRHSTTLGALIVGARSNTNDDTHSIVLDNQDLVGIIGTGWDGSNYEIGGLMRISVDGTPGANDMPGRFEFLTTPNGSAVAQLALRIRESQRCDFYTNQALGGGAAATLGTIGGSGPTAAAQAQWLEIEIGGVIHWVPAWT